jgi:hypothetical protein
MLRLCVDALGLAALDARRAAGAAERARATDAERRARTALEAVLEEESAAMGLATRPPEDEDALVGALLDARALRTRDEATFGVMFDRASLRGLPGWWTMVPAPAGRAEAEALRRAVERSWNERGRADPERRDRARAARERLRRLAAAQAGDEGRGRAEREAARRDCGAFCVQLATLRALDRSWKMFEGEDDDGIFRFRKVAGA